MIGFDGKLWDGRGGDGMMLPVLTLWLDAVEVSSCPECVGNLQHQSVGRLTAHSSR